MNINSKPGFQNHEIKSIFLNFEVDFQQFNFEWIFVESHLGNLVLVTISVIDKYVASYYLKSMMIWYKPMGGKIPWVLYSGR